MSLILCLFLINVNAPTWPGRYGGDKGASRSEKLVFSRAPLRRLGVASDSSSARAISQRNQARSCSAAEFEARLLFPVDERERPVMNRPARAAFEEPGVSTPGGTSCPILQPAGVAGGRSAALSGLGSWDSGARAPGVETPGFSKAAPAGRSPSREWSQR